METTGRDSPTYQQPNYPSTPHFLPNLISSAMTDRTQIEHVRLLKELVEFVGGMGTTAPRAVTGEDVARYLQHRQENPRRQTVSGTVKWTTIATLHGHIMGALRDARYYGFDIQYEPNTTEFRRLDHSITRRAHATRVDFPTPASFQEVNTTFEALLDHPHSCRLYAARYLALWWITASRPLDATYLHSLDMTHGNNGQVSIKFLKGKGVNLRGPYTVHTALPDRWARHKHWILHFEGVVVPEQRLQVVQRMTLAQLRITNPKLEARSIRRGSAQSLAATGASDDTLMMFTGHTSVATLHRYLDWGAQHQGRRTLGETTARLAWTNASHTGGPESTATCLNAPHVERSSGTRGQNP